MKKTLIFLALWQAACAATSDAAVSSGCGWTPDPEIHGAHLDNESAQSWTRDPDFKVRLRKTIEAGAEYWGQDPYILWGWKIQLQDHPVDCGVGGQNKGCVDWLHVIIKIDATDSLGAIESSALVHEIGHIAMPGSDPYHWDDKWWDREALASVYYKLVEDLKDDSGCVGFFYGCEDQQDPRTCYLMCAQPEYRDFYAP